VARPLSHIVAVRLDARTIDRLAEVRRAKGLGPAPWPACGSWNASNRRGKAAGCPASSPQPLPHSRQ
jgi:hypothetical protein